MGPHGPCVTPGEGTHRVWLGRAWLALGGPGAWWWGWGLQLVVVVEQPAPRLLQGPLWLLQLWESQRVIVVIDTLRHVQTRRLTLKQWKSRII